MQITDCMTATAKHLHARTANVTGFWCRVNVLSREQPRSSAGGTREIALLSADRTVRLVSSPSSAGNPWTQKPEIQHCAIHISQVDA